VRTRHHLILAAALVASGCLSLENRLLYYPVPTKPGDGQPMPTPLIRDVYLRTADDNQIHARWFQHPQATGAILYCPGNAGNLEYRNRLVSDLAAELKMSVLIFDYPGYGESQGHPTEKGCYAAATAAYDWLTHDAGIPPDHLIIYGESLGGGVAVDLASRRPHRTLVLVRTFSSVPDVAQARFLLPIAWLVQNRFDSLSKIADCRQPVFIAYADKDQVIPGGQAQKLKAACPGPAELFLLKGLGHNDPPGPDFYAALRSFLDIAK
jgi:fermentation-respiration switch protein FrsA (DUF1100 family)